MIQLKIHYISPKIIWGTPLPRKEVCIIVTNIKRAMLRFGPRQIPRLWIHTKQNQMSARPNWPALVLLTLKTNALISVYQCTYILLHIHRLDIIEFDQKTHLLRIEECQVSLGLVWLKANNERQKHRMLCKMIIQFRIFPIWNPFIFLILHSCASME